ncbi:MAG: type IV pilin [Candidatus Poseidoniales archaeon]|nr:type IV pilin [Candidatus Poseidoniales archaeon]
MQQAEIRRNEEETAVSPVIATILMVAITVVLAGVLYVWANSLASEGTDTSVGTLNTYTTEDADDETGPGADDTLVRMQVTGKDDLAWSFIKITVSVGDNVYTCSVVAGDDCEISQAAGDNDNAWEPGEYLFLSEGTEDICSEAACRLEISVTYNGRTLAGDRVSGQDGNTGGNRGGSTGGGVSYTIVTIDDEGNVLHSSDSETWEEGGSLSFTVKDLVYGEGKFVATGKDGNDQYFAYSSDGGSWTESYISNDHSNYNSIAYGGDVFVSVGRGQGGWVMYNSGDGETWNEVDDTISSSSGTGWMSCTMYGEGKFVTVSHGYPNDEVFRAIYSSDGGQTWDDATHEGTLPDWSTTTHANTCVYADGKFWSVAANNQNSQSWIISQSDDGVEWTSESYSKISCNYSGCGVMERLFHDGTNFVASDAGSGGSETDSRGAYSADGDTWTTYYNPMYTGATMTYVDGTYVFAGMVDDTVDGSQEHYNAVYTSTDLTNWDLQYKSDDVGCCGDKVIATSLD